MSFSKGNLVLLAIITMGCAPKETKNVDNAESMAYRNCEHYGGVKNIRYVAPLHIGGSEHVATCGDGRIIADYSGK